MKHTYHIHRMTCNGCRNHGVLIKNVESLEKMNKVNTLIVDKTETLTEGKPAVEKVGSFDTNFSEKETLNYIVSLNTNSEHPLVETTVKYGKVHQAEILETTQFAAVTGKGVKGEINNHKIALGNLKMMITANANISDKMEDVALAMSFSSVSVIGNALRLRNIKI